MTKIAELFIIKRGRYYYIEYLLLNADETESKRMEWKAIKYRTFREKLDQLLLENELI